MSDKFHISSLLVSAKPEMVPEVAGSIEQMDIAEIAHIEAVGKIIVTLETIDESAIVQALTDIQLFDGVVSASLVFHHCEPVEMAFAAGQ